MLRHLMLCFTPYTLDNVNTAQWRRPRTHRSQQGSHTLEYVSCRSWRGGAASPEPAAELGAGMEEEQRTSRQKCAHGPTFSSLPQLALGALQSPEPAAKLGAQMEEEQRQLFKAAKTDAMKGAKPHTAAPTASSLEGALLSLHELHHTDGTKAMLPRHLLAACSGIDPQPFRYYSSLECRHPSFGASDPALGA